jgi:hypothetical protein
MLQTAHHGWYATNHSSDILCLRSTDPEKLSLRGKPSSGRMERTDPSWRQWRFFKEQKNASTVGISEEDLDDEEPPGPRYCSISTKTKTTRCGRAEDHETGRNKQDSEEELCLKRNEEQKLCSTKLAVRTGSVLIEHKPLQPKNVWI